MSPFPPKRKLVLVGNGMAGMRAIEELLALEPNLYDITVFGAEPHGNYNRILLSPVLAAEKTIADIMLNTREWYAERGITLIAGDEVVRLDRARRRVISAAGVEAPYDRLILATGSNPIVLPLPGKDLPGVVTYRDIADVERMIAAAAAREHGSAIVIGGGLLGLEAAYGLQKRGMDVTVVHLLPTLMERQLDAAGGDLLRRSLEQRGLKFKMPAQTQAILGEERARAVCFADGTEVATDLVVMAVGIRPNVALAKASGLACERGVLVSDTMQTFDPRIYALGECVQHRGACYGLVAPLFEQAKVLANHLAEFGIGRYPGSQTSTKLKVTGIDLFSAGDFAGGADCEELVFKDAARGVYKKIVVKDDKIRGAVLYGDTVDGAWYFQLLRDGTPIADFRESLLFGQAHLGDSGLAGAAGVTALPDTAEICGCNGVCKGAIVKAITAKNLFTLDEVRAHTKASSSCGSCTGLVEQLLANTLGGDYSEAPAKKPLCPCTIHTHEEVRQTIVRERLKSIPKAMEFLEWKTPDGCHKCRPALNFYLLCAWPGEYEDDKQSRFINERAHGNIQRDGTYSVVPRIWGGVTSAKELRAIADVAEKYAVPTVKFTGGQRLDLLGVKKEDLPKVWKDLNAAGLVSGHAYGKALRTVKTCVGKEWCRFGTQDSTGLGIKIERATWGSWHPHKVKLAVSGCPRNCAEATIKDLGVVCVESGYELHVGGNGGIKVRATDFLCKVATEEEVLE
ncbi:MAG TPA: nitrite reductase large subunit NirB, partial [Gammaproteobacteria bacterium]|nr:nitrite reductase large subunit NirB [Gammaproteobacteria bacterium]